MRKSSYLKKAKGGICFAFENSIIYQLKQQADFSYKLLSLILGEKINQTEGHN